MLAQMRDNTGKKHNSPPLAAFFDNMPIQVEQLVVRHVTGLHEVDLEIRPGHLVFITGEHDTGKTSLLKILADCKSPDGGRVLMSSHNRCLHVCEEPLLLKHLSLLDNLGFGSRHPDPERINKIFMHLGLGKSAKLRDYLHRNIREALADVGSEKRGTESPKKNGVGPRTSSSRQRRRTSTEEEVGEDGLQADTWFKSLSSSEFKKLHLCRALVYNPQVLAVHKAVDYADSGAEHCMLLAVFRDFVNERGIECDGALDERRPRTAFFTGGSHCHRTLVHKSAADIVWTLTREGVRITRGKGVIKQPDMHLLPEDPDVHTDDSMKIV